MTSTFTRLALVCSLALAPSLALARSQEPPAKAAPAAIVNVNTASQAELEALPGIGPSAAKRIVDFRTRNGGFKKVEDLMKIQGIGERSFLKLRPLVTVGSAKGDAKAPQ